MRSDIPVLILAAGASSRMGRPKQLLTLSGVTLLERAIEQARALSRSVWVVTGCCGPLIRFRTRARPHRWVHNPAWASGMASSLQAGLHALPAQSRGVLVLLVDQPEITLAHLHQLLTEAGRAPGRAIASGLNGRPVVPAYLPAWMWRAVDALEGDMGGRQLLSKADPLIVPCSAAAKDLDTLSDWRAVRHRISQGEIVPTGFASATLDKEVLKFSPEKRGIR